MRSRNDSFRVVFEVQNDGTIKAAFAGVGKAAEDAGRQIDDIGDRAEELGRKIGTSLKWAGGIAAAGLALVIHNTIKAEQELAQLDAILKSTGNAAGYSRDQLVSMADELSKKSIFSGGEIIEAQTRLLSYSGIVGENIPRAMQAAIDQSARLGMSLTQSAETIGRALESPSKAAAALAQQGFGAAFTDEVRKTIKALEDAGREAEAQQVILDILEESYAGAAEAARDTFGGALIALKNTLADVTTGSDGSLQGATDAVNDLIDTLNDPAVRSGFAAIVDGAVSATSALLQFIPVVVDAMSKAQEWLNIQVGGNRAMGGENLAEQRRELQLINAELERRDGGGNMRPSALGLSSRSGLEERKRELREVIAMNEMLFGDPSRPRINIIDPSDPASMLVRPPAPPETKPPPRPRGGASGGRGGATTDRDAARAEAEAKRLQREAEAAAEAFDQLEATLQGPLKEAEYEHKQNLLDIADMATKAGISGERLADVIAMETERYNEQREAIERQQDPARQMIEDMEFELSLLGMTNSERELAIQLRRLEGQATAEQIARIRELNAERETAENVIGAMDEVRAAGADLLVDLGKGENPLKSVEDALDRLHARLLQMVADKLMERIFGNFGSTGQGTGGGDWLSGIFGGLFGNSGGSAGGAWGAANGIGAPVVVGTGSTGGAGFWASLAGAIFGGGRAYGGSTRPNMLYEINEGGAPEVYRGANGRTWMLTGNDHGDVVPMGRGAGGRGGDTYNITVPADGIVNHGTRLQYADRLQTELFMARRNQA